MAITHTETVTGLTVLNDGTNIVSEVEIKTVSVDDSDPSNLTHTVYDSYPVNTTGITTTTSGFIEYGSLSETVVKGWIADELSTSMAKINAESWINSVKTPPTLTHVNKDLPF